MIGVWPLNTWVEAPFAHLTLVESDEKAPFSIATILRCRGGHHSFPWIPRLYPWYVPYIAECLGSRYQVLFLKSLVWPDTGLNTGLPTRPMSRGIGLRRRAFASGLGDQGSILGWVIPKTQKMLLDAALLNTQHCKIRVKSKAELLKKESLGHPWIRSPPWLWTYTLGKVWSLLYALPLLWIK